MPRINRFGISWAAVLGIGLIMGHNAGVAEAKGPIKQFQRFSQQSASQGSSAQLQRAKKLNATGVGNSSGASAVGGQLNAAITNAAKKKSNKPGFNVGSLQILKHNAASNIGTSIGSGTIGSAVNKAKQSAKYNGIGIELLGKNQAKNQKFFDKKNVKQQFCKDKGCKKFNWFHNHFCWNGIWCGPKQHHHCWVDYCYVTPVLGYYNPYCYGYTVVEVASPIVAGGVPVQDSQLLRLAVEAFRNRDAQRALDYATAAVKQNRNNGDAHQLRSLILFALRDYEQAAAEANVALTGGPGWSSETLLGMYASADEYAAQLQMLEQYVAAKPELAAAHFLLGYHYLMIGRIESGTAQLAAAVQLEPRDTVAAQLLAKVRASVPAAGESAPLPMEPAVSVSERSVGPAPVIDAASSQPSATGTDVAKKVGTFTATPAEGVTIKLTLDADGTFTWMESVNGATQQFSGKFTLENGMLTLTRGSDNDAMASQITDDGPMGFTLRPADAGKDNPGLQFRA